MLGTDLPDCVVYFIVKIHWGLNIVETQRQLDILPFIDRIQVYSGEDARAADKMLVVQNDFLDIINDESTDYRVKINILRDEDMFGCRMTIVPKFVGVDLKDKIVDVIING